MRRAVIAAVLIVVAALAVSSFALWQDGRRFAAIGHGDAPAPEGVADAGYVDPSRLYWKSGEKLRAYAEKNRQRILAELGEDGAP